ncbi:ABC transporter permease [Lacrimispora sp. NSJ-141]|uniref:ABC transporter permease n=1 Tax=Lientehia hominis TaxID=2897778 RepID=A0AAP2RKW4_9FIRM|nr:ABC transporter permease [Lientehia hominis]MCD2493730.1 ABC transporter permease [Lientehia hominis]
MRIKTKLAIGIFSGIVVLAASCFLAFRAGKGNAEDKDGESKEIPSESVLGEETAVIALSEGETRCDFSSTAAVPSLMPLADILIKEIKEEEDVSEAAAFYLRKGEISVYHGMDGLTDGSILGIGMDFMPAAGLMIEKGRGITEKDALEQRRVAVLNDKAAMQLFYEGEAIGEVLEIEGKLFQVVGIAGTNDKTQTEGLVLVPDSTWPQLYQYEEPKAVALRSGKELQKAAEHAERVLNSMVSEESAIRYKIQ